MMLSHLPAELYSIYHFPLLRLHHHDGWKCGLSLNASRSTFQTDQREVSSGNEQYISNFSSLLHNRAAEINIFVSSDVSPQTCQIS